MIPTAVKKKVLKMLVSKGLVSKKTVMKHGANQARDTVMDAAHTLGYGLGLIPGMAIATPIRGGLALGSGVVRGVAEPLAGVGKTLEAMKHRRQLKQLSKAMGMTLGGFRG